MRVKWSDQASADVGRLHDFLALHNRRAAAAAVRQLVEGPNRILAMPRIGQRVERSGPEEVRRLIIGDYELRYEVRGDEVVVLSVFHTREDR